MTSDGDLVRQTLSGDTEAYADLVRRWSGRALAVCHARVACAHAAEDLAQESLLRAFRNLAQLADPEKFGPWLRGIAQRVCLDWLKARQNSQVTFNALEANNALERLLAHDSSGETAVARAEEIRRLLEQLTGLPEKLREVLMLYYYDDVTYRDLAELLGVSTATINARLTKARAMLRSRLDRVGRP